MMSDESSSPRDENKAFDDEEEKAAMEEHGDVWSEEILHGKDTLTSKQANTRKLSEVSKQYDLHGAGVLNDIEQAMRDMDSQNKGYLSNDKVYDILEKQMKMQAEMFNMKRIMFGLVAFSVILALSNLGTAFAAARLAKDTTIDANGNLVDKYSQNPVGVQTPAKTFQVTIPSEGDRRLDAAFNVTSSGEITALEGATLKTECKAGNNVQLTFTTVCPDNARCAGPLVETIAVCYVNSYKFEVGSNKFYMDSCRFLMSCNGNGQPCSITRDPYPKPTNCPQAQPF